MMKKFKGKYIVVKAMDSAAKVMNSEKASKVEVYNYRDLKRISCPLPETYAEIMKKFVQNA